MKYIKSCLWKELFKNDDIIIPDFQRIIDRDKIEQIIELQKNNFINRKKFIYFGVITICLFENKKYLIDGQHRFLSMKKLYEKYNSNSECNIEYIQVNSLEEINDYYNIINKNTPLPCYTFTKEEKNILNEVCYYFQEKYKNVWSKGPRTKRPFIFFNYFQESLSFINRELNINDKEKLIKIIEEKNNSYKNLTIRDFKNINENMLKKANEFNFFLGLFTYDINENYGFLWAKNIVEYHTNTKIQKTKKKSKKSISKALKYKIWNKYIGSKNGEVYCISCVENKINMMNFECGHIIPESKGGETTQDNLLPICGLCNKSMATKNMNEFIKENFPENIKNFNKKKYISSKSHGIFYNILYSSNN